MDTMNIECTAAVLFALGAYATGHWIVGCLALGFICLRIAMD